MKLRCYQTEIIDEARDLMRQGVRNIAIVSPTGSGKTLLTAHMLKAAAGRDLRCWFIVHRRELIDQSVREFRGEGVSVGIIASGYESNTQKKIQICSIQTLARRLDRLATPNLIVWDECHHVAARSWSKVFARYPLAYHIGLTATPERLDGRGLRKHFSRMVQGPEIPWLIKNQYLAPYRLYAPNTIDVTGVHKRGGDFARGELATVCDRPTITGSAILEYQRYAEGKRALVFCVSIEHSRHVAKQFNSYGYVARHVDGLTPKTERDQAVQDFRDGKIQVITNCDLFGEGFDLPAIECAILLRPTQSLGLHRQQIGRALRPFPGKEYATILDHAGNVFRHGLADRVVSWSLDGRKGREGSGPGESFAVRSCPKCYAVMRGGANVCLYCAHVFAPEPREIVETEGDLVEVDVDAVRKEARAYQARARTLEALVELGKSRGYNNPWGWAQHIMRARGRK